MTKLRKALANRRGEGYPAIIAITLALMMLFMVTVEYFRINIIAQGIRDALQSAVISVVTENYDDVYHGVREGYAGGYQPMGGGFEASLDYGDVYARLDKLLGLTRESGGRHVKYTASGQKEYTLSDLNVSITNTGFAPGSSGSNFVATCTLVMEVPVHFVGKNLPPMRITLRVKAGYRPVF